jgi:hypothetical protein
VSGGGECEEGQAVVEEIRLRQRAVSEGLIGTYFTALDLAASTFAQRVQLRQRPRVVTLGA